MERIPCLHNFHIHAHEDGDSSFFLTLLRAVRSNTNTVNLFDFFKNPNIMKTATIKLTFFLLLHKWVYERVMKLILGPLI